MPAICFYFQVHQPWRIKRYRFFDIGKNHSYFDGIDGNLNNEAVLKKVARKSYLPANRVILELLRKHPEFRVSFSLSGVFLDQLEAYAPDVLASFQELAATGRVEMLDETYYHSLSFLFSRDEFIRQVAMHNARIRELFGLRPLVFRNTELIYNNALAEAVEEMGYKGVLAEGATHVLGWRSPDFLYRPKGTERLKVLLKNYKLSDDIAFRFSSRDWSEWPLDVGKFSSWVTAKNGGSQIVNLFMDYETFGEHQWEDTGIFNFLRHFPGEFLRDKHSYFVTPSEAVDRFEAVGEFDVPYFISWADIERDLSAWLSNPLQEEAMKKLYALEGEVLETGDPFLTGDWRRLQTSDHFYYMCTKWFADGDVHKYFNPYETPYDAFISFMNALEDLRFRLSLSREKKTSLKEPSFA